MAQPSESRGKRSPQRARSRTALSSVANAMRLLKAFTDEDYELGANDLAKRLRLAKSTVLTAASDAISQRLGYRPIMNASRASRDRHVALAGSSR